MEKKFNRYLWYGTDTIHAKAKVAWEAVCLPEREGGLVLKRVEEWNRAAILRHIWNLFANAGSLWVSWVREYLLKGKSFWLVKVPQMCSWSWKKLLKLRDIAKNFLHFNVGDGRGIHLWLDRWHQDGILYDRYSYRIVYDAGSKVDAKLVSVLKDKSWIWPPARSVELVHIQSQLPLVRIGDVDKPVWSISKSRNARGTKIFTRDGYQNNVELIHSR